ncbi:MAG TPA: hypothetical protein PKX76_01585 [Flexilinea sp.]|jgi:uncharacterized membrane protein YczE|nr:MAG: hypothetical protein BWY58_01680 [Chloroflexi bacterium ADurb.Bin344]HOG59980.1 hypothetical protein [Flexilinea sp.]
MRRYLIRFIKLFLGLFLFSIGTVITIKANIGLAPWDAFHMGISIQTGISFGKVVILTGVVLLIVSVAMKEKFGFGTVANVLFIGIFCDFILSLNIIPICESYWLGIVFMLIGLFINSFGMYFYINAGFGAGPRDSIMIALNKRFPKIPVGAIRGSIEGIVLFFGWLMGAKVGLGTILSVFGISFILQFTFRLMHFDVKKVKSESVLDTIQNIASI